MKQNMKENLNKQALGIVAGLVLPILVFLIFYKVNFSAYDFMEYLSRFRDKTIFVKSMPAMLFINLGLVIVLTKQELFRLSRGIIAATVVYGVAIFLYAFL